MQQTEVRLKLELNGEVRRVTLVERSFQCLQKQVCKLFSLEDTNFSLKYKDDEGDLVTISSEEEFNEALGYLQNNLLRLKIIKLNKETQEGEQERGGRCGRFRKFMEFKKWKEAQKSEDKQDKEEDGEEECKPWKRFFVFKSPHGPQHPRHPHHHFHHHQRQEEQGENGQQHPFFPPRFGPHPHHPHHFHRHHHHGHQHQNEQEGEKQKFFGFPPRPHHPHHFHRHHHHGHQHQEQEAPRFRFPPSDAPFGFFGRPHHHHRHQHQQEQQKEDVQPFDFLENLGNLAKNLFGGVLNGESSLEDLLETDIFKVEHNYICDGCDQPISGTRHHCTECPDFDFCSSCFETKLESHAQHKFEKVTAFEALKQALQNGQKIDAFFVKRNGEEASNETPKQEENKPEDKKSEPEQPEPEQPKQEEITVISTNVEVPQPSETSIAVEPSTNVIQTPIENPSEPKPTEEVVVYPFQKKLEDLEVMGFTDRKKNILALLKNKGDLELTIEQLLN